MNAAICKEKTVYYVYQMVDCVQSRFGFTLGKLITTSNNYDAAISMAHRLGARVITDPGVKASEIRKAAKQS